MWRIAVICALLLVATAAMADSLQWEAGGVDENHAAADGFKIHYGAASGSYTNTVDVGNVLTWPLPDAWPAGTYYFAASAYNADGESEYSNEAVWIKADAPTSIQPASGGAWSLMFMDDNEIKDENGLGIFDEISRGIQHEN